MGTVSNDKKAAVGPDPVKVVAARHGLKLDDSPDPGLGERDHPCVKLVRDVDDPIHLRDPFRLGNDLGQPDQAIRTADSCDVTVAMLANQYSAVVRVQQVVRHVQALGEQEHRVGGRDPGGGGASDRLHAWRGAR